MKNIRLVIEYEGTDFSGWQYQPEKRTVQGEIEQALKKILCEDVRLIGAGRTDQGVHAKGQVANFHTNSSISIVRIKDGVNALTGSDLYIRAIDVVDKHFHSRFSARSKIYQYHIIFEPFPLQLRYNWYVRHKLNIKKINDAIPYLIGEHDFDYFSVSNGDKNTQCNLLRINLTHNASQVIIEIEGNRFLRKMVRGIIGFLYDVGRGRFEPQLVNQIFAGKMKKELYFVPARGLVLVEVKY